MCDFTQLLLENSSSLDSNSSISSSKTCLLKKNSRTKISKRLLIQKKHVNNVSKKPYKIIVPRVIDSDIRKHYPIMFLNMLNGPNIMDLGLFMYKFTSRGCMFQAICHDNNKGVSRPVERFAIDDVNQVVGFYETMHYIVPDRIYKFKSAEVKTRSDTFKSIISIDFELIGTKTYDIRPIEVRKIVSETPTPSSPSSSTSSVTSDCASPTTDNLSDVTEVATSLPETDIIEGNFIADRLPPGAYCEPRPLILQGTFTMVVEDPKFNAKISAITSEVQVICD